MPLQIRRGTEAERQALTSTNGLVIGELLYVTDDRKLYVGTGNYTGAPSSGPNAWWKGAVATSYNDDDAKAAAGTAIIGGTHQNITFTYDNIAKTISSTLDLSDYNGTIKASSIKGSVLTDDGSTLGGITLVDATNGSINLDGTVKGNIVPDLNITWDIGTPLLRFRDLYLSGSSIYLGNAVITANGTAVDLPAGTTIGGLPLGGGGDDYSGNIIADDSTIIVNTATKVVTAGGGFVGDLTGTVTGSLIGNVAGVFNGDSFGYHYGDVKGSVVADDSSMLVDGVASLIVGDVFNTTVTTSTAFVGQLFVNQNLANSGIILQSESSINDPVDFLNFKCATADPDGNGMVLARHRGTIDSPAAIQTGDTIFSTIYAGWNTNLTGSLAAKVDVKAVGSITGTAVPGQMDFYTADASGSLTLALSFDQNQVITVANNTLTAGVGSGQVDVSAVATYLKINIGGVEYAIPAYNINP